MNLKETKSLFKQADKAFAQHVPKEKKKVSYKYNTTTLDGLFRETYSLALDEVFGNYNTMRIEQEQRRQQEQMARIAEEQYQATVRAERERMMRVSGEVRITDRDLEAMSSHDVSELQRQLEMGLLESRYDIASQEYVIRRR